MLDKSPLVRQWKVLTALAASAAGRGVTELAREHAVTGKTIRRDLILLQKSGFPLAEDLVDHGRKLWRLAANDIPPQTFNWQEAMSLLLAQRFLEPLAGTYFAQSARQAFSKIRAMFGTQAVRYLERMAHAIHVTSPSIGQYAEKASLIDRLTLAVEECRVTLLTYQSDRSTEPVSREIHPYAWVFHRDSPYLVAFATEHREVRLYKADRVTDAEVLKLQFPRPADFSAEKYLAGSFGIYRGKPGKEFTVQVRFLPPVVQYVREKQSHVTQELTPIRDGSLLAEFRLTTTDELKRWLLSFGANALVLKPASLRDEIVAELRALLKSYEPKSLKPVKRAL